MTDYEKIKAFHDYIINNSVYDKTLFDNGDVPPESYATYGTLILGVGVCESYAKAMKYLLDGVGIESSIVVGESKNQSHAWNLVKIEEDYYHIDSTWDDPVTEDNENILQYNYFLINDDEISNTHTWEREDYPEASGKKYNYFTYNNLTVDSETELKEQLKTILFNREAEFLRKINNHEKHYISITKLIEDIVYPNQRHIGLDSYSYYMDDNHGIINIRFNYR